MALPVGTGDAAEGAAAPPSIDDSASLRRARGRALFGRDRQRFGQEDLDKAWELRASLRSPRPASAAEVIKEMGRLGFRRIPLSTLGSYFRDHVIVLPDLGRPSYLTRQAEEDLVRRYPVESADHATVGVKATQKFAQPHRYPVFNSSYDHELAYSRGWYRRFLARMLSTGLFVIRDVKPMPNSRAVALNPMTVVLHACRLQSVYTSLNIVSDEDADRICNVDETGFDIRIQPSKMLVPKDSQCFEVKEDTQVHITVLTGGFASGRALRPLLIIGTAVTPEMVEATKRFGAFIIGNSPSGYATSEIFTEYVREAIVPAMKSEDPERKSVILLDQAVIHKSTESLDMMRQNGVFAYPLPSHTSHVLQPADDRPFQVFKQRVLSRTSGLVDIDTVVEIIAEEHNNLFPLHVPGEDEKKHWASGFKNSGAWPVNPHVVTEKHYGHFDKVLARCKPDEDIFRMVEQARDMLRTNNLPKRVPNWNLDRFLAYSRTRRPLKKSSEGLVPSEPFSAAAEPVPEPSIGDEEDNDVDDDEEDEGLDDDSDVESGGSSSAAVPPPEFLNDTFSDYMHSEIEPFSEEKELKIMRALANRLKKGRSRTVLLNGTMEMSRIAEKAAREEEAEKRKKERLEKQEAKKKEAEAKVAEREAKKAAKEAAGHPPQKKRTPRKAAAVREDDSAGDGGEDEDEVKNRKRKREDDSDYKPSEEEKPLKTQRKVTIKKGKSAAEPAGHPPAAAGAETDALRPRTRKPSRAALDSAAQAASDDDQSDCGAPDDE